MRPIVSVVVPIYNVEKYLRKCIESLLNQTLCEIEIILVNDGSTDQCGAICHGYAEMDKRIQVIDKNNGGISSARNVGLAAAKGEYVSFVDSDDWIDSEMLETLVNSAKAKQADITICGYKNVFEDGSVISKVQMNETVFNLSQSGVQNYILGPYLTFQHAYSTWNKLYKRELIENNKLKFFEGQNYAEDMFFNLYAICHAEKIYVIPHEFYNYMYRDKSLSRSFPEDILVRLVDMTERFEKYLAKINKNLGNVCSVICWIEIIAVISELVKYEEHRSINKKLILVEQNSSYRNYLRNCIKSKEYNLYLRNAGFTKKGELYMKCMMLLCILGRSSLVTKIVSKRAK